MNDAWGQILSDLVTLAGLYDITVASQQVLAQAFAQGTDPTAAQAAFTAACLAQANWIDQIRQDLINEFSVPEPERPLPPGGMP